mmetsp:Transcript_16854/g.34522  ORF Transcript_16854/g.34522 Transcript_16854/m.34522 type:complete len:331 (+) Transcript_16854:106-1098(+)
MAEKIMKCKLSAVGVIAVIIAICTTVSSFSIHRNFVPVARHIQQNYAFVSSLSRDTGPRFMFFADEMETVPQRSTTIITIDGSETSVYNAAKFMVDAFWLQSPQQLVQTSDDSIPEISYEIKSKLITQQADDIMKNYGERLGRRKLEARLLIASGDGDSCGALSSTENVQGMVTIEVRLMKCSADGRGGDILNANMSEKMLTQAIAALRPKQRREYKDASVIAVARELLPPDVSAVCSISNLCVAPSARRKGIAAKLCKEAEKIAKEEFGFDEMYLRVERENDAAKRLYEMKLGYERKFDVDSATALRVDAVSGSYIEVESGIVIMSKRL